MQRAVHTRVELEHALAGPVHENVVENPMVHMVENYVYIPEEMMREVIVLVPQVAHASFDHFNSQVYTCRRSSRNVTCNIAVSSMLTCPYQ